MFVHFTRTFLYMQIKLESFSPKMVSASKNKELLINLRVYGKSETNEQTDGWKTKDGRIPFLLIILFLNRHLSFVFL